MGFLGVWSGVNHAADDPAGKHRALFLIPLAVNGYSLSGYLLERLLIIGIGYSSQNLISIMDY